MLFQRGSSMRSIRNVLMSKRHVSAHAFLRLSGGVRQDEAVADGVRLALAVEQLCGGEGG